MQCAFFYPIAQDSLLGQPRKKWSTNCSSGNIARQFFVGHDAILHCMPCIRFRKTCRPDDNTWRNAPSSEDDRGATRVFVTIVATPDR